MHKRIRILKGLYNKLRISDSTFTLIKPIEIVNGVTTATIDASSLLGDKYKILEVEIEYYQLLD